MPRTPRTKSKGKIRKRLFKTKVAGQLKIKKLLRDIDEARHYGINLRNNISLGEMYSYLEDARKQKKQHEEEHPGRAFQYDDMQDEQPAETDGLDELASKVTRRLTNKTSNRHKKASKRSK